MFRYKKLILEILCILYIVFTIIELLYYMNSYSNIVGVIYLCVCLLVVFLFVPLVYNYKRVFSGARISKMILIFIIGMFNSFMLHNVLNYIDTSLIYINKIFMIKNIIKPIIYSLVLLISIYDIMSYKVNAKQS